ncbi:type II toxin-antitoxin system antitoxin HipB [Escherichia coli]
MKLVRQQNGWTQSELAKKIGIKQATISNFENNPDNTTLTDFARMIPAALDNVKTSLPTDFPENVVTAVETNVLRLHGRLSREYGSK